MMKKILSQILFLFIFLSACAPAENPTFVQTTLPDGTNNQFDVGSQVVFSGWVADPELEYQAQVVKGIFEVTEGENRTSKEADFTILFYADIYRPSLIFRSDVRKYDETVSIDVDQPKFSSGREWRIIQFELDDSGAGAGQKNIITYLVVDADRTLLMFEFVSSTDDYNAFEADLINQIISSYEVLE